MSKPDISIIIPFAGSDRLKQLQTVLDTFYAQDTPSFEIILVQGDAAEATGLRLEPCVRTVQMDEPPGSGFNKSRLFNAGVQQAKSRYLLLHDADIAVPVNYIGMCLSHFRQGWESFCPIRFLFYLTQAQTTIVLESRILPAFSAIAEIRQNFAGGSVAITSQAFHAIGGFNEAFEGWGGEDVEFLHRARKGRFFPGNLASALHLWHPAASGKSQDHPNLTLASELIVLGVGKHHRKTPSAHCQSPEEVTNLIPLSRGDR